MSNILHPTIGDLIDRFTILELKIQYCPTTTSKEHFISEWREIEERLRPLYPRFEGLSALHDELMKTNRDLWTIVDEHRDWYNSYQDLYRAARILEDLWGLNSMRRRLMSSIDKLTNTWAGEEKV